MKNFKEKLTTFFKENKNKKMFIAAWVFVLTLCTIGFSYAAFFTVKTNKNNQTVTTGNLSVSYGGSSSAITTDNMQPYSDSEGLEQKEASIIYIQNEGSLSANYVLTVGYDMENFLGRTDYMSADKLTPVEYIKVAVYEYNGENNSNLIVGPVTLADLPVYKNDSAVQENGYKDGRYNRYAVLFDTLGTSSNATKTYQIKMWLSDKAISSTTNSYFYANAEVISEAENSRMEYSFKGKLNRYASNTTSALSGATITLQRGGIGSPDYTYTATTASDGSFTVPSLAPGRYLLNITASDITYKGSIEIVEGTSKSITSFGSKTAAYQQTNIKPEVNMDLMTAAYVYGTSVNNFMDINNITMNSTAYSLQANSSYLLNPSYIITGASEEDLGNLTITISNYNTTIGPTIYSMSLS